MSKPLKRVPEFRDEDDERAFWAEKGRDSTQYLDWSKARPAQFPNLKPSTRAISLRLPVSLLERIKVEANKRDVPYQSLIKVWLAEKLECASPPWVGLSPSAKRFIGSDKRGGNVSRESKRLLREHSRGK